MGRQVGKGHRIAVLLELAGLVVVVGIVVTQPLVDGLDLGLCIRVLGQLGLDRLHRRNHTLLEELLIIRQRFSLREDQALVVRHVPCFKAQQAIGIDPVNPENAGIVRLDHRAQRLMADINAILRLVWIIQRVGDVMLPGCLVGRRELLIIVLIRGEPVRPLQRRGTAHQG